MINQLSAKKKQALLERIKANVTINPETQCWEWNLCRNSKNGYGLLWIGRDDNKRKMWSSPHKAIYELLNGPIPEGLEVAHKCHCRHCCNPDHLVATDHKTNMQMSVEAGRIRKGEGKPNAILTESLVRIIRERKIFAGRTHREVAAMLNIGLNALRDALYNITWKHVTV